MEDVRVRNHRLDLEEEGLEEEGLEEEGLEEEGLEMVECSGRWVLGS